MEETKHKFIKQFESVLLANLLSVSYGAFLGWPSVTFLTNEGITIPIMTGLMTNIERGTLCIGGVLGTISFYFLADRIGARKCLLCLTIPAMMSWITIYCAKNSFDLCVARLVGGFTGALLAMLPIYATEICETKVRGTLGTLVVPSINIGMLMAYSLGNYLSNEVAEVLLAPYPLIFVYFFSKLPDTPYFDIKCGNLAHANKSLRFYRNTKNDEDFEVEFNQLIEQHPEADKPLSLQDFNNRVARKALLIGSVLMLLTPLCGALALMNYTQLIFKASGCDVSVALSSIIMRIIQLAGSLVPLILVDYAGRKVLLIISAIGAGISLVSFGIHSFLTSSGFDLQAYHWIPITSFAFSIFISSWGMVTLPFLIVSEIMPPKIRNGGGLFCVLMFWLGTFTTIMLIDEMDEFLGTHNVFFLFATCCFLGAVFIIFVVPETKGKSLEEISLIL